MTTASPSVWRIFLVFFRIGATAYGGPGMMPFMRDRLVEKNRWLTNEEFKLGLALCTSLPGATLMQLSAYIGLCLRGFWGALAGYAGFGAPAFLLVTALSALYVRYHALDPVIGIFAGLKVVVLALLIFACYDFSRRYTRTLHTAAVSIAAAALFLLEVNPVPIIFGAGLLGAFVIRDVAPPGSPPRSHDLRRTWTALGILAALVAAAMAVLYAVNRPYFELAWSMFTVDIFAFGGFGAFPIMYHEVVEVRQWLDPAVFLDGIALGQVTPGPILLTSSFVGYLLYGIMGAVVAGAAIFTPSFLILLGAVPFATRFLASRRFQGAMAAVLATLGGLIAAVAIRFGQAVDWTPVHGLLLAAALYAFWRKVDILWVVLGGVAISVLLR